MALVKPIVNDIVAFDARYNQTITFTANGGDQVTKNEIKVVSNEIVQGYFNAENNLFYSDNSFTTPIVGQPNVIYVGLNTSDNYLYNGGIFTVTDLTEIVIYQHTVSSYEFSHIIPANTLENGKYYKVAIRTYDIINNSSQWSNYQPFYCYRTPILMLNIEEGQTITTQTYRIQLQYLQVENEKVDYALIEVYNNNNVLIGSSGNLYNSNYPPLIFDYDIVGLKDDSQYYVQATVVTINGTIVQTDYIRFYTDFEEIINPSTLTATLNSCEGYVNLHSSILKKIGGISNPQELEYINNNTTVNLRNAVADFDIENSYWVKWNKLISIPQDFLLRLWFYPARQPFKIIELRNEEYDAYLTISFKRGTTTDYLSIRTDNGTVIDKPLGIICNGNIRAFLWIKVIGSTWDVQTSILGTNTTYVEWNSYRNNLPYNTTSNVVYGGETYENFTPSTTVYQPITIPLTSVEIGNGAFDHLNITKDTSIYYNSNIPTWDEDTILDVNFNGNINDTSPNYTKLVLKRKDSTLLNWLNLSEKQVNYNVPTYIDFNDSFIPTGIPQEYALVVYLDDIPSEYHTVDIVPTWSKYFLSDKDTRFTLNYAVIYSNHSQNIQNGVLMPIGSKYPIVIQNGEGNYRSGSLQFKVLGYQFEENQTINRTSIVKQTEDILAFLTNGKAKCLTDFNGNIFIIKVINSPQVSYDANYGNGITTISFDWVEQAKYNDYESMLNLGLFEYVATE